MTSRTFILLHTLTDTLGGWLADAVEEELQPVADLEVGRGDVCARSRGLFRLCGDLSS